MKAGAIWQGVKGEHFGPSPLKHDHLAALEARGRDEPVPSRFYNIGRLSIAPELLMRACGELDMPNAIPVQPVAPELGGPMKVDGDPEESSRFLRRFLATCGRRFGQVVQQELSYIAPGMQPRFTQDIVGGPYSFFEDNDWHRDDRAPGGISFLMTVIGPTTEFATGSYGNSQFDKHSHQTFTGPEIPPEAIQTAGLCDIIAFDSTFTLHRAPTEEWDGTGRIFSHIFAYDVLHPEA